MLVHCFKVWYQEEKNKKMLLPPDILLSSQHVCEVFIVLNRFNPFLRQLLSMEQHSGRGGSIASVLRNFKIMSLIILIFLNKNPTVLRKII